MESGNIRLFMVLLIIIDVRLAHIFFGNGPIFYTHFVLEWHKILLSNFPTIAVILFRMVAIFCILQDVTRRLNFDLDSYITEETGNTWFTEK